MFIFIIFIQQAKLDLMKEIESLTLKFPYQNNILYFSYDKNSAGNLNEELNYYLEKRIKIDNTIGREILIPIFKIIDFNLIYSLSVIEIQSDTLDSKIDALKKQIKIKSEINKFIEEEMKN